MDHGQDLTCAVCGRPLDPNEAPDFDAVGDGRLVCSECREQYGAELSEGVERAKAAWLDDVKDSGEHE
jgi:recombinational DNA repair protein (RecF pathway)